MTETIPSCRSRSAELQNPERHVAPRGIRTQRLSRLPFRPTEGRNPYNSPRPRGCTGYRKRERL